MDMVNPSSGRPGFGALGYGSSFAEFLASRRTTRDFQSTPVPDELIRELIHDALTAPSWSNTRPFKVAIATGDVRDRISSEFLRRWQVLSRFRNGNIWIKIRVLLGRYGLPTSNRFLVRPYVPELKPRAERVGRELYEWIGIKRGDRKARDAQWGRNYEFFGAPVELFIFIHKSLHVYAANDAGLMLQNLILSAHAKGLGTCLQGAVIIWDDVVRKEFEISDDYRLLTGLAIGYPKDARINEFKANRLEVDEVIAKRRSEDSDR
jgi:nitroreductase